FPLAAAASHRQLCTRTIRERHSAAPLVVAVQHLASAVAWGVTLHLSNHRALAGLRVQSTGVHSFWTSLKHREVACYGLTNRERSVCKTIGRSEAELGHPPR